MCALTELGVKSISEILTPISALFKNVSKSALKFSCRIIQIGGDFSRNYPSLTIQSTCCLAKWPTACIAQSAL